MLKYITIGTLFVALNGCAAVPAAAIYSGSLVGVERAATSYMVQTRPDVSAEAGVACITGAMTRTEIVKLGTMDSRVLSTAYKSALDEVANRPEAANCLAALEASAA